jgi:hypothetical protein
MKLLTTAVFLLITTIATAQRVYIQGGYSLVNAKNEKLSTLIKYNIVRLNTNSYNSVEVTEIKPVKAYSAGLGITMGDNGAVHMRLVAAYRELTTKWKSAVGSGPSATGATKQWVIAGEAQVAYIQPFDNLHIYVMIGLGLANNNATITPAPYAGEKIVGNGLVLQVTPVGISFGKKIKVFAEAGYGYKGILNTGIQAGF